MSEYTTGFLKDPYEQRPNISDRARENARAIIKKAQFCDCHMCEDFLTEAFTAQANEIWEEAAKIADEWCIGHNMAAGEIAKAIRARKSSEPTT